MNKSIGKKNKVKCFLIGTAIGIVMSMGLTACGGSNDPPQATLPPTTPVATTTPAPIATPAATTAPAADASIVGTWEWVDDFSFRYTFNANGTGTRGFGMNQVHFQWETYGTYLDIYVPSFVEEWAYIIEDDLILFSSLQVAGMEFLFEWAGYVEDNTTFWLEGAWDMVGGDFGYIFFTDGTGIRGSEAQIEAFYWAAYGNDEGGILEIYAPSAVEEWDFTLAGDTLTIFSPYLPGIRFIYNRIN